MKVIYEASPGRYRLQVRERARDGLANSGPEAGWGWQTERAFREAREAADAASDYVLLYPERDARVIDTEDLFEKSDE